MTLASANIVRALSGAFHHQMEDAFQEDDADDENRGEYVFLAITNISAPPTKNSNYFYTPGFWKRNKNAQNQVCYVNSNSIRTEMRQGLMRTFRRKVLIAHFLGSPRSLASFCNHGSQNPIPGNVEWTLQRPCRCFGNHIFLVLRKASVICKARPLNPSHALIIKCI